MDVTDVECSNLHPNLFGCSADAHGRGSGKTTFLFEQTGHRGSFAVLWIRGS